MSASTTAKTALFVYFKGSISNLGETQRKNLITDIFSPIGEVYSIYIPTDKATGDLRNFCFVEMDADKAQIAIDELDNTNHDGVILSVGIANKKNESSDNNRSGGGNGRYPSKRSYSQE